MNTSFVCALSIAAVCSACASTQQPSADSPASAETTKTPESVAAQVQPTVGNTAEGEVQVRPVGDNSVQVSVSIEGATPGLHGVHIHQYADCSAGDATSAGGHFNPQGFEHALPPQAARHLGDLGNIDIGDDGTGNLEVVVEDATLNPDSPFSFVGRALIVHAGEDTGGGESGEAGARVACAELNT